MTNFIQRPFRVLVHVLLLAMMTLSVNVHAADLFSASELAEHLYLVTGPSGNTLVAADTDGLILVEGVPAELAEDYLVFIKDTAGDTRIKALINTHWHPESTGLNATLAGEDVEIIAHANTRQWLGATIRKRGEEIIHTPVPEQQLPDRTFYIDLSIPFRGASIELGYLLHAHTDGDIYAYFPAHDILYTGPAVRSDSWSSVDETTNGFIGGLMDAYDALAAVVTDNTRIVPLSGPLLDKAGFDSQMTMYKDLMAGMVALLRQSRSAEEVVIANPATGLKPAWGDPAEFLDQGFRSFYGHLRNARHVGTMP